MGFISPIATDANGNQRLTGSQQSLGKDDFLQLLVTKLQYQDPLKPMEDQAFVAQLAQFSTLEQMSNIADGIDASNEWDFLQMQSLNNVLASGLIGKEVKADFSGMYLDATTEPSIAFELDEHAETMSFDIYDAHNTLVATITKEDLTAGTHRITWDGEDSQGNRMPDGYYTVQASGRTPSGNKIEPELSLVGIVTKVLYRDGGAYLTVSGTEISLGDIVSVGQPEEED
ncbi:hypothetical protein GF377_04550 [candidate division GN15 bacterium]|nr:hypothetical protein [candidate division GN15 bacterium]